MTFVTSVKLTIVVAPVPLITFLSFATRATLLRIADQRDRDKTIMFKPIR